MSSQQKYPLVSIVIATYNGEMYLVEQLDSIFSQTYPNIEIIAVDDASTDNTLEILNKYSAIYKNIKIFESTTNRGYIRNFEIGMSYANGKFISPCDQDDVWEINKVEELVKNIDNYPAIYCDSFLVDDKLNYLKKNKLSDIKNMATYNNCLVLVTDNCVAGHAMLITKELYNKSIPFPKNVPHDWWLSYQATFCGGIKYLDKPLVKYRNHINNVIGGAKVNRRKKSIAEKKILKKIENEKVIQRVKTFYDACSDSLSQEKKIIGEVLSSYQSKSFNNNCKRVLLFLKHKDYLLAIKKRKEWYKTFFCFKMFYKIK